MRRRPRQFFDLSALFIKWLEKRDSNERRSKRILIIRTWCSFHNAWYPCNLFSNVTGGFVFCWFDSYWNYSYFCGSSPEETPAQLTLERELGACGSVCGRLAASSVCPQTMVNWTRTLSRFSARSIYNKPRRFRGTSGVYVFWTPFSEISWKCLNPHLNSRIEVVIFLII